MKTIKEITAHLKANHLKQEPPKFVNGKFINKEKKQTKVTKNICPPTIDKEDLPKNYFESPSFDTISTEIQSGLVPIDRATISSRFMAVAKQFSR